MFPQFFSFNFVLLLNICAQTRHKWENSHASSNTRVWNQKTKNYSINHRKIQFKIHRFSAAAFAACRIFIFVCFAFNLIYHFIILEHFGFICDATAFRKCWLMGISWSKKALRSSSKKAFWSNRLWKAFP